MILFDDGVAHCCAIDLDELPVLCRRHRGLGRLHGVFFLFVANASKSCDRVRKRTLPGPVVITLLWLQTFKYLCPYSLRSQIQYLPITQVGNIALI